LSPIRIRPALTSSRPASIPQRGGLAAAGRPDEDEELAIADLQVELVDGGLIGPG